jgi:diguanylate cyclase (GGDEF)-like protein
MGGDHPAEEVLYRSDRTVVTRSVSARWGGAVVRTVRTGPEGRCRLVHESMILRRLAGLPGVPHVLSDPDDPDLVVQDAGAISLARLAQVAADGGVRVPWPVAELLTVAIDVASVLGGIHSRGVIHRDVNPANIVVHGPDHRCQLIDFELAVTVSDGQSALLSDAHEIRGTLAYLAPEQTGRTGRPIDQRTDLYALGATLYELACGRPPFGRGEDGALALIHDHLARQPVPPSAARPDVPAAFSDVVARLLDKEPDRRYQSAEGLLYDLRLIQAWVRRREDPAAPAGPGAGAPPRLGTRDFPLRLRAPAHPVAREEQIARLAAVFAGALAGHTRALLVTGPAGVGKTALVDELRPTVTEAGGWFVSASFAPEGAAQSLDAGVQALGALARMILAEPESQLRAHREQLLAALGDQAGLLAGILPEYELLLAVPPHPPIGDPAQAQAAVVQVALAVLRTVTRCGRPVVLLLDGLQWAPAFALELLDAALAADTSAGLLLVGTYRDDEAPAAQPLAGILDRWRGLGVTPEQIRLGALGVAAMGALLAEVLRLPAPDAGRLAGLVHVHTGGNPYDTIELLNALRRDGLLAPGSDGWLWDAATIQRYVGGSGRAEALAARIGALPQEARGALEVMACLGGDADLQLLSVATGVPPAVLQGQLAPSLGDGLLVTAAAGDLQGLDALRMPHDSVGRAVLRRLGPAGTRALQLLLARRLAADPGYRSVAAEHYLPVVAELADPAERARVVDLFADAAADLRVTGPAAAERYLGAAITLLAGPGPAATADGGGHPGIGRPGPARIVSLQVARHAVLYGLGRFDAADEVYEAIEAGPDGGLEAFAAGAVQVASLTNRARPGEAVALGVGLLRRLGHRVPPPSRIREVIAAELGELYAWAGQDGGPADLTRAEISDPRVRAAAEIISMLMPPAFFSDQDLMAWLVLESRRIWDEHGPCRALVAPLCHAAVVTIAARQDFRVGYRVVRRALDASLARRYEPETSRARFLFAVSAGHWFEPLESVLDEARLARDGLLNGGDSQGAVFTYHSSLPIHLDTAATLDEYLCTVDSGLALADRTGNDQTRAAALPYRQLAMALSGQEQHDPDDAATADSKAANPMADANGFMTRALLAALLGDQDELARQARAALPLLPFLCGHYAMARVYLLQALALSGQLRSGGQPPGARAALLAELDDARAWLEARANDSPTSFAHLLSLVEAERSWALGDLPAARTGFDRALQQAGRVHRPWHRAYLLERAALFALGQGEEHGAGLLLGLARRAYAQWGAAAKVRQLERSYPLLRDAHRDDVHRDDVHRDLVSAADGGLGGAAARSTVAGLSAHSLDLLSVLKASQALSRETDLDQLRVTVTDVLTAMTGATAVTVLLKDEDGAGWVLPGPAGDAPAGDAPEAGLAQLVPLSVVRYAARTGEPVVLADAATDHRFVSDPCLAGAGSRSLLVVPILSRGEPRVMLVLENRLHRGVFSADRLDAVQLVAGQLAVSFDIALARRQLEQEADRRLQLLGTLRAREHLLETLLAIQRDISHRAPLQRVLDAVTAGASGLLGGGYVALVLADPASHNGLPQIPSVSGASPGPRHDALMLSVAAEAIATDAMVSRTAGPDEVTEHGTSLIAAPVHVSGEIIGSLVTATSEDGATAAERPALLAAFAEQVSLALNDATTLQAIRAASLDSLTGLATRPLFLERLGQALRRCHGQVSVLFIDLDRFKQVNDSLGHDAGDQLLAAVAERMRSVIRDGDTGARLGGDEFAILLEDTKGPRPGLRVGAALTKALMQPMRIGGKELIVTASVGVAVGVADATPAQLLKQADLAMYRAKRERSRRPVLFEHRMHEDVAKRLDLQGDLERAVRSGQIWVQYQPQLRLDEPGQLVGVEALARWTHPDRGPVSPAEFIPIAEDTGIIVDLGRSVLRAACWHVARWRRELHPGLRVSVNVSGRQLTDGRLAEDICAVLAETGLDPAALILELTESVLMDDSLQSLARLEELKRLGVGLALDDFGTGYSSLSYLHRFPVDELKIDRSFVEKIDATEADQAIVRVVVELAKILNLRITAEGVATEQQRHILAAMGCQVGQGYLFAAPLSHGDASAFLARQRVPHQSLTARS